MDWLSWIFPRRCVGCHQLGAYICPDCLNLFQPLPNLYCPVCRRVSLGGRTHPHCLKKYEIDGLISCFAYRGIVKWILAKYKYQFVSDLHPTLTELFISEIQSSLLFRGIWTLIPVPLHLNRQRWRGFNQAELLAKSLSQAWGWPVNPTLLRRSRSTSPQMSLPGTIRHHNLAHAFRLQSKASIPASVLLVDDVATTCSTLRECARLLKRAGAHQVWGATFAQVIPVPPIVSGG